MGNKLKVLKGGKPKTAQRTLALVESDAVVFATAEKQAQELEQRARQLRIGAVGVVIRSHGLDPAKVSGDIEVGPKGGQQPKTLKFDYPVETGTPKVAADSPAQAEPPKE